MTEDQCVECDKTIYQGNIFAAIKQRGNPEATLVYCLRCAWIELTNQGYAGTPAERTDEQD